MANTKFYFGRIIFKHQLSGLDDFIEDDEEFDKVEKVRNLLLGYVNESDPVYREDGEVWRFGRVEEYEGLIIGKFGKVFAEQPMQYDDDAEDFVESREDEEIADVSFFVIFPEKNVIAFNRKKRIGHKQFAEYFAEGYNFVHGIADGMEIKLIKDGMDIERVLEEADNVFSVDFSLVPTNPVNDEEMRVLDTPMQEMGADELIFYPAADTGSLETDHPYLQSGFALSNNGYGDFEMSYEQDGENKIYNSRNRPARFEIEEPDGLGGMRDKVDDIYNQVDQLTINGDEEDTDDR